MCKKILLLLLSVWVTHLYAQQNPVVTGNTAFYGEPGSRIFSGVIGEPYLITSTKMTQSQRRYHIGFPYAFIYTKDAFKGDLSASKGYYNDYVRLQWELYNPDLVSQIKIYRRELSETEISYRLVTTLSPQENSWQDPYAEPGVMYQYKVLADDVWDTEIQGINIVEAVGFRVTSATVTGRITYEGGSIVRGVKVIAEPEQASNEGEFSYAFPDSVYGLIKPSTQANLSGGATVQAWVLPELLANKTDYPVFSIGTNLTMGFYCDADSNVVKVSMGDEKHSSIAIPDSVFTQFMQLSFVWEDAKKMGTVYLNGDTLMHETFTEGNLASANWFIGAEVKGEDYAYFSGHMEELKLWSKAMLPDEIYATFDAYENPNNSALAGYWKFNEGGGDYYYDISRKGNNFNENHALIVSHKVNASGDFEKVFPSSERLGCKAVSDENGNYVIAGIPYSSGGSYFRVVPALGVHRFDPTNKLLYISSESSVFNNIDFTDVSSFTVTGKVKYKDTKYPVSDVYLKVDGTIVADKDKQPIKTDSEGRFEIDVPIGEHFISIEKQGHVFASAYWPKKDEFGNPTPFDFQDDVYELEFLDTTKVTLVGKVVGGPIQAAKATGSLVDPSENNLGEVEIKLTTKRGLELWNDDPEVTFTTDAETGVYKIDLIPEEFIFPDQTFPQDKKGAYIFNRDEDISVIDMRNKFVPQFTVDSVYRDTIINEVSKKIFEKVDTVLQYNHNRDWIWRSTREISVVSKNDSVYLGDSIYNFKVAENTYTRVPVVSRNTDGTYDYVFSNPIFTQLGKYEFKISAHEQYLNSDDDEVDVVPVTDGIIVVENQIANTNRSEELQLNENGEVVHTFWAGMPLTAEPYTQNINFKLKVDDNFIAGAEILQPAYVFGAKPAGGMNFVTGADEIDFILRDPAGSDSYSYFEKGFTTTKTTTDTWANGFGGDIDILYMMGVRYVMNAGTPFFSVENQIDTDNSIGLSTSNSFKWTEDRTHTSVRTYQFNYSTSSASDFTGSQADVFFGHGTNIYYGAATNVKLLEDEDNPGNYMVGTNKAIIVGKTATTDFVYSANHIENYLIPNMKQVRNSLFESEEYTSKLKTTDPYYGLSNDDPVFNGAAIDTTDTYISGPSYIFTPAEDTPNDSIKDEIFEYNQKINNWYAKLALNEQLKLGADGNFDTHNNYTNLSFDAGASIESSVSLDTTNVETSSFEWSIDAGIAAEVGFTVNKFGMKAKVTERFHHEGGDSSSDEDTDSKKVGFVLADGDQGDYFSMDVKVDTLYGGPVFKLRGGQSVCPYEGTEYARFYEPEENHEISAGTLKRESPEIGTETSLVTNVPEGLPATFKVNLSNTSDIGANMWYGLFMDAASNPDGAIVKLDGKSIVEGIRVLVPAGQTVVKTVTVEKGRASVNEYDNIRLILHSLCQFDPTDDIADISDTVAISAHFIEQCTEVAISSPADQWTVNSKNTNALTGKPEMHVKFSNYDLNHDKFEDFMFQYKPSEQSTWITAKVFVDEAKTALTGNDTIEMNGNPAVGFTWDMSSMQNRTYDIRAISHCSDGSVYSSEILSGIFDNKRPQLFGAPTPANGILAIDDELKASFSETIQAGVFTSENISVSGITNGTDLRDFDYLQHNASLHFDGVTQNMTIAQDVNLKYSPFTFEFWAKREGSGKECLVSQGDPSAGGLWIGFDDEDRFVLKLNGETITSNTAFTTTGIWNHYAVVYSNDQLTGSNELKLVVAHGDETDIQTKSVDTEYFENSPITVGYCAADNSAFEGNMHDFRIWNQASTSSEIQARRYTILSGYERGLIGAYPMDDVRGDLARDLAFARHGQVNATWHVSSTGSALDFKGGYVTYNSSEMELSSLADFTLEFWFKSAVPASDECLFSNGKADGSDTSELKWALIAGADGQLKVLNDGREFAIDATSYLDNNWHHFALAVNRRGNMNVLLDGEVKISESSELVSGMGGAKGVLGARYSHQVTTEEVDLFFNGAIDEFRIWSSARSQSIIQKYMNHSLRGEEFGLKAYFPFEDVTVTDPSERNETLLNKTTSVNGIAGTCVINGAVEYSTETAAIKLARPTTKIPFNYVINDDQILITPNIDANRIENTILDVAIEGVYDMHGNRMESAASWSAFVNRNQLLWEKQRVNLSTAPDESKTFKLMIYNKGGSVENWELDNLPLWLSADSESGELEPLSSQEITFTVSPAVNTGKYTADIYLNGSMDFNERCTVNLSVVEPAPDWTVNPSDFEASMIVFAKLKIADVLSTDVEDKVGAFVNGQCRGVSNVQYFADRDLYMVNLTVYGGLNETSTVEFKVWDASEGNMYSHVTPSVNYAANKIEGKPATPILIETTNNIGVEIPVAQGWNWLSFNLNSTQLESSAALLEGVQSATGDQIKSISGLYDEYVANLGWDGTLSDESFEIGQMYKLRASQNDVIELSGEPVLTSQYPISILPEWNWIGYTPQVKMPIKSALSYHQPKQDDVIKSQTQFAMYDASLGWIGSLTALNPNKGYMYYSNNAETVSFVYPQETLLKSGSLEGVESNKQLASQYEYNMSAMLKVANSPVADLAQSSIWTYSDGELVGMVTPLEVEGNYLYAMTVSGSSTEKELSFVLSDGQTQYPAHEQAVYKANKVLGSVNDPFLLTFDDEVSAGVELLPNPFAESVLIKNIPEGTTQVAIYDVHGKLIRQWTNVTATELVWNGCSFNNTEVPTGIYIVKVFGETASQQRVLKMDN